MFRQEKMYSGPARTGVVHILLSVYFIFTPSGSSKISGESEISIVLFSVSRATGVHGRILVPGVEMVRLVLFEKR